MAIDMFKCPKCGNMIYDYDWVLIGDDEEGSACTECDIVYSGEELSRLLNQFDGEEPDTNFNPFAD